ncbi:MAG: site-specific integrase [Elusimicrobiota bacterium]
MARIYKRADKKGGIWYLDYVVEGRRVRKRIGQSKRLAELAKADIQVKLERKEIGFARSDKKLEDLVREYLRHSQAKTTPMSHKLNIQVLEKLKGALGSARLKNITHFQIEKFKNKRREDGAKPGTVNRELAVIKALFNRGVEWGFLIKSPAQGVKKLKEAKRQARFFSQAEVSKILSSADEVLRPMLAVYVHTGLRRDELLNLTWEDVDLERRLLIVQAKDGWSPKDYEVRHIPLNDKALQALKGLRRNGKKGRVFCGPDGKPYLADFVTKKFKKHLKRIGIDGHLHALRHTFASHLVMQGVDLHAVAKLLGHASTKTTEIYAHLSPDFLKSAVGKLKF